MPAVVKIDPQRRIVCSTFLGDVTDEQLMSHRKMIASEPQFKPEFADLVDFSAARLSDVSPTTLAAMAGNRSIFNDAVPHVVVAAAERPFLLATKYSELARESRRMFVVRTLADAYKLLSEQGYA